MTDALTPQSAQLVADLAVSGVQVQSAAGLTMLVVPAGYKHIDLTSAAEKARMYRDRKVGTAQLLSVDSLVQYAIDQTNAKDGYAYADVDARTITFVFDDWKVPSVGDVIGWREHRAQFKAELTPECKKWMEHDRKALNQSDFAEFIEDNLADIGGAEATNLLDVATTISAKTDVVFSSAKRLDNGQVQFTYNEVINAAAGPDGSATIPRSFTLGLRIFKGDKQGYAVHCRLKYRMGQGGRLSFTYEIDRFDRVLEDAFDGYVEKAKTAGYTVLMGKAGV